MSKEIPRPIQDDDALMTDTMLKEIRAIAASETDVTWTDSAVTIALRSTEETNRARSLGLFPVGATLVILRKDRSGNPVNTDEMIRQYIQTIKNS